MVTRIVHFLNQQEALSGKDLLVSSKPRNAAYTHKQSTLTLRSVSTRETHLSYLSDLLSWEERVTRLLSLPLKKSYQPLCLQQMSSWCLKTVCLHWSTWARCNKRDNCHDISTIRCWQCTLWYITVPSPLDGSKRFNLHLLADLFIPIPHGLLWEAFSHAASTTRRRLDHIFWSLPTPLY